MNYSLEDGLEPSSSIISVYIHWRRNPGIKKNWVLSVENVLLRRLLIQLKARDHVGKEDVKESQNILRRTSKLCPENIGSAAELLAGGNPIDAKKLSLFRTAL